MKKKFITNNANDDLDKVNHATKEVLRFANQHLGQFLENFNHSCNKKKPIISDRLDALV